MNALNYLVIIYIDTTVHTVHAFIGEPKLEIVHTVHTVHTVHAIFKF